MPTIVFELAAKYGGRALAILLLLVSIVAGYYYWKHNITLEATNKAIEKCNESKEKFRIDAENLKDASQKDVDDANAKQTAREINAIEIENEHADNLRNTPVATSLRVKTDSAGSCSDTMSRPSKGKASVEERYTGSGEAQLSERNIRQLNSVIDSIEKLELKCEQLLNSLE